MALTGKLPGETQIASVKGKEGSTVFLTDKRVVQEDWRGLARIIPLTNIDSFGLVKKQKLWLLILGLVIALYAIYSAVTANSYGLDSRGPITAKFMILFVIGAGLIAAWWFSKKVGGIIVPLSGSEKTEIFFLGRPDDIVDFLNQVQMVILNKKVVHPE